MGSLVASNRDQSLAGAPRARLIVIVVVFVAVHAVLGVLDFYRPEVFLRGDRAAMRMQAIHELLSAGSWAGTTDYLANHGVVGDYAFHALLYAMGGKPIVILFQIALLFVSGAGIVGLARLLGMTPKWESVCLAVYFALPHSLVFPHQLTTEALEVPLLVLSTWLLCKSTRTSDVWLLVGSAALLGTATLIRPITLLWPAIIFLITAMAGRKGLGVIFAVVACAPVLLWMSFIWAQTGVFGLGESNHSLGHNLYLRTAAVAATMPKTEARAIQKQYLDQEGLGRLSVAEFMTVALHHPLPFLAAAARDALVFWGKSGIERLTLDYRASGDQFKALTSVDSGWREHFDTSGPMATLRYTWRVAGPVLFISFVGSALFIAMIMLSLYGAVVSVRQLRSGTTDPATRVAASILIILPVYLFAFSLVTIFVRSGLRAGAEFALVILAVYGLEKLRTPKEPLQQSVAAEAPFSR